MLKRIARNQIVGRIPFPFPLWGRSAVCSPFLCPPFVYLPFPGQLVCGPRSSLERHPVGRRKKYRIPLGGTRRIPKHSAHSARIVVTGNHRESSGMIGNHWESLVRESPSGDLGDVRGGESLSAGLDAKRRRALLFAARAGCAGMDGWRRGMRAAAPARRPEARLGKHGSELFPNRVDSRRTPTTAG